jgi:hypothetical protein
VPERRKGPQIDGRTLGSQVAEVGPPARDLDDFYAGCFPPASPDAALSVGQRTAIIKALVLQYYLERAMGFEPTTPTLAGCAPGPSRWVCTPVASQETMRRARSTLVEAEYCVTHRYLRSPPVSDGGHNISPKLAQAHGPCSSYMQYVDVIMLFWRSLGDSNPCFRRERRATRTSANHGGPS